MSDDDDATRDAQGIYLVKPTARARRDIANLPAPVAWACLDFTSGPLAQNPHRVGKPLRRELEGLRSARRGSYRIIYRIRDEARVVEILRIDQRPDVYRP